MSNIELGSNEGQRCRFLILACSAKNHKYCLAGLKLDELGDGSKYSLVRLVTDDQQTDGAVPSELLSIEDEQTQAVRRLNVLNIVEYYVKQYPSLNQPENYLICSNLLSIKSLDSLKDSMSPEELGKLMSLIKRKIREISDNDEDGFVFYNTDRTITSQLLQSIGSNKHSLELRVVERIRLYKTINSVGQCKVRADFTYKGKEYSSISVTDPQFFNINQIAIESKCLVLFSLANQPFLGEYYKLIASVMEVSPDADWLLN